MTAKPAAPARPTPGPWTVLEGVRYPSIEAAQNGVGGVPTIEVRAEEPKMFGGTTIAAEVFGICRKGESMAEARANARLIAAAPALRDALAGLLDVLIDGEWGTHGHALAERAARAALALVEGR
jgi:hypothetical protein